MIFEYTFLHWTTFLTAAFLLNLSPGPDMAFMLGQTLKGGKRAGFYAMFGIWTGAAVHVLMAAIGLSAIILASSNIFQIVKWIGALYLIWLGINAMRSRGEALLQPNEAVFSSGAKIYKQGVTVSILNPKVAIFFLAFLPQFVVDGAGPVWMQLSLHGVLVIIVAVFIEPPLILMAARIASIAESASIGKYVDRVLGGLLIGLGIKLGLSEI